MVTENNYIALESISLSKRIIQKYYVETSCDYIPHKE